MTREDPSQAWTYLRTTLSSDRTQAHFTTTHLSYVGLVVVNPAVLFSLFKKYFIDGIDGGITGQVDKPRCDREHAARAGGFEISSTRSDTAYWCFGYDAKNASGKRVLKIVNNRTYYLLLSHRNMAVLRNDHKLSSYANLAKLDKNHEIVEPGKSVLLNADLDPGQSEAVATEFDGFSQNLYAAQTAAESLLAILTKFGSAENVPKAIDIMDKIAGVPKCFDALTASPGAVLANCFSAAAVLEAFGTVGLLITPLIAVGGLAEYFRSSYHAVVDQFRDRDTYEVAIYRKAPSFAAFIKPWAAHVSQIKVSRTGYVKEFVGDGCCIVVADLEYQLSNPRRYGKGWVADATVRKVRQLGTGTEAPTRIPHVGRTYLVRALADGDHLYGVAEPDFRFCRESMANYDCGA